jgi:hypothetical protein
MNADWNLPLIFTETTDAEFLILEFLISNDQKLQIPRFIAEAVGLLTITHQ